MSAAWCLINRQTGGGGVRDLRIAADYWSRLAGLQFRRRPPVGQGLLLSPCSSVHTCWVRYVIDVVGIAKDGRVTAVKRGVRPWRAAFLPRGTRAVVEASAGEAGVDVGDYLGLGAWVVADGQEMPGGVDPKNAPPGVGFLVLPPVTASGQNGSHAPNQTSESV